MKGKLIKAVIAASVLAAVPASAAHAAVCTTGSLSFCFNFTFTTNEVVIQFNPTGSGFLDTGLLTDIGIYGYTGITTPFSISPTNWSTSLPSGGGTCGGVGNGNDVGVPSGFQLCVDPPPSGGLVNNGTVTITFTGSPTSGAGADLHIQAVDGGSCSVHVNSVGLVVGTSSTDCGSVSTTPEPASLALVGTGLLSIGGFGFLKRRRRA